MQKSVRAYATRAKNVQDLIKNGDIPEEQGKNILAKYISSINTSNSDVIEAVKKAQALTLGRSL